jgi:hypothetical protein
MSMPYNVDSLAQLEPWLPIFMYFSVQQFEEVYEFLDFPTTPNDELRRVAYSFALNYLLLLFNRPDSELYNALQKHLSSLVTRINPTTMLEDISEVAPETQLQEIFQQAFRKLDEMGVGKEIYEWSINTYKYNRILHVGNIRFFDSLSAWFSILRRWASIQWMRSPNSQNKEVNKAWNTLKESYSSTFLKEGAGNNDYKSLPLSESTKSYIQLEILTSSAEKLRFQNILKEMDHSSKNTWDRLAFDFISFYHEGEYRLNIRSLSRLVASLSSKELEILNFWASQHMEEFLKLELTISKISQHPE